MKMKSSAARLPKSVRQNTSLLSSSATMKSPVPSDCPIRAATWEKGQPDVSRVGGAAWHRPLSGRPGAVGSGT